MSTIVYALMNHTRAAKLMRMTGIWPSCTADSNEETECMKSLSDGLYTSLPFDDII